MASEKFGPHLPTIIEGKHIKPLYELWGIDYAVEVEAPNGDETSKTVRPGYCGAYTSHFEDGGLSFPLPLFFLEVLAELGMAFAQMAPNFFRYFLASWIRAMEEGLEFGLEELKKLFAIKRNNGFPVTMILAPRPGRSIIDGIRNRDDLWREKFFVFNINPVSIGDIDFGRIPREWSDDIEPFGSAPMTPELRGWIATMRRDRIRAAYAPPPGRNHATPIGQAVPVRPGKGLSNKRAREKEALPDRPDESSEVGSLERAQKARREPTLRSRSQAQSPGLLARPVSIDVVGVENGYDEVNIQISAKYKYEYLSAINCVWSEECRDICNGNVSKPATDMFEYDDRNTNKPSSVTTQLPHMHTARSLRSDRTRVPLKPVIHVNFKT
ncbi:hypothetical protein IGI04_023140 [Brassica rapa subsp. trilocularis]|uniref:Uncharacterized protein n=1 Tax=Brassica rapa subsp. trilocularis TaxID=1813537 RepID=A0ABQ7M3K9_BRACM|nr:hypothetical protein IGI04_023140 [Brassica rapa subsp. trilocularis]